MVKWLSLSALMLIAGCAPHEAAAPRLDSVRLEQTWRLEGLANPESVVLSPDGAFLYVSNVNGEGEVKDGNGFISRVSLDGAMMEREFARGLDAPKGLAVRGDAVYAADIDAVAVIDAASGAIRARIPAPGAVFLNDVAFAPNGQLLVADSGTARLYAVQDGVAEVWREHALLESVNGLLAEPSRLVVTTMAGRLLAVDYRTRAITVLAEGLGDADGVAALGDGRYLVSEWPGLMHVVDPADGSHVTIQDTRSENRLLNDFLLIGDMLYQPHWTPGELTAYRVSQGAPNPATAE
jgi:glucose/arabinose dehydrogenase